MTETQFEEFVDEIIPQQLFHVSPDDIDDETGCKLEEVILIRLIAQHIHCLKYKPLQWFINKFL